MEPLPKELEICFTREQIASRTAELGKEIAPWVRSVNQRGEAPVLAICVLRGAAFFFADLLRAIPISVEPAFCRTRAYEADAKLAHEVQIDPSDLDVRGRSLLVVDDICDSGSTLQKLETTFLNQGAAEVKSAVTILRQTGTPKIEPTWAGFTYPGLEWFVGYGMDMGEKHRNLPEIYRIIK